MHRKRVGTMFPEKKAEKNCEKNIKKPFLDQDNRIFNINVKLKN